MLKEINQEQFAQETAAGAVLVDFFGTWCGPCRAMNPALEAIQNEMTAVKIVKVDVDESADLAQELGVMSVPNFILFKDGTQVAQTVGFQPKAKLADWIQANL